MALGIQQRTRWTLPGLNEACNLADPISHCHLLVMPNTASFFIYIIPNPPHNYKGGGNILILQLGKLRYPVFYSFPREGRGGSSPTLSLQKATLSSWLSPSVPQPPAYQVICSLSYCSFRMGQSAPDSSLDSFPSFLPAGTHRGRH